MSKFHVLAIANANAKLRLQKVRISKEISEMDDLEVADKTGCHIPCMINEYSTKLG